MPARDGVRMVCEMLDISIRTYQRWVSDGGASRPNGRLLVTIRLTFLPRSIRRRRQHFNPGIYFSIAA